MLHSLESVNYLKIDQKNFIEFDFATDKKQIRVVQQFTKQTTAAKGSKKKKVLKMISHTFIKYKFIKLLWENCFSFKASTCVSRKVIFLNWYKASQSQKFSLNRSWNTTVRTWCLFFHSTADPWTACLINAILNSSKKVSLYSIGIRFRNQTIKICTITDRL